MLRLCYPYTICIFFISSMSLAPQSHANYARQLPSLFGTYHSLHWLCDPAPPSTSSFSKYLPIKQIHITGGRRFSAPDTWVLNVQIDREDEGGESHISHHIMEWGQNNQDTHNISHYENGQYTWSITYKKSIFSIQAHTQSLERIDGRTYTLAENFLADSLWEDEEIFQCIYELEKLQQTRSILLGTLKGR